MENFCDTAITILYKCRAYGKDRECRYFEKAPFSNVACKHELHGKCSCKEAHDAAFETMVRRLYGILNEDI